MHLILTVVLVSLEGSFTIITMFPSCAQVPVEQVQDFHLPEFLEMHYHSHQTKLCSLEHELTGTCFLLGVVLLIPVG